MIRRKRVSQLSKKVRFADNTRRRIARKAGQRKLVQRRQKQIIIALFDQVDQAA